MAQPPLHDRPATTPSAPPPGEARGGGGVGWAGVLLVLLAAGIISLVVAFFVADESAGPDAGVTLQEVAEDPEEYVGESVTVSGEVADVEPAVEAGEDPPATEGDPGVLAFTLGEDLELDERVLIVSASGEPFGSRARRGPETTSPGLVNEDSVIQVTGTVRRFTSERFGEIYGPGLYEDGLFDDFEGRPVIVATAVDPTVPREG